MLALGKLLELTLAGREPAQKIQLTADGVRLRWLGEGALEVTPPGGQDTGLDVLLSAGIHGNETAPIELLDRLLQGIARGDIKPRARILFLFGNPGAMRTGNRFVEEDLNRLFNGRHESSCGPEAMRACELEHLAKAFFSLAGRTRLHYDLHTAIRGSKLEQFALYPFKEGRAPSRRELARLRAAGMEAVLLQSKPSIVFSAFTCEQLDAEAFTLELGKALPLGENDLTQFAAVQRALSRLLVGDLAIADAPAPLRYRVVQQITRHSDDFRLHMADQTLNFTPFEPGTLLAEEGETRYVVGPETEYVLFPNPTVAKGLRAGLMLEKLS